MNILLFNHDEKTVHRQRGSINFVLGLNLKLEKRLPTVRLKISTSIWNWVFATNLNFLSPISLQPNGVNLWYFKLRLFDLPELKVWNIKGAGKQVAKLWELENLSLWQKLNSFNKILIVSLQLSIVRYFWFAYFIQIHMVLHFRNNRPNLAFLSSWILTFIDKKSFKQKNKSVFECFIIFASKQY